MSGIPNNAAFAPTTISSTPEPSTANATGTPPAAVQSAASQQASTVTRSSGISGGNNVTTVNGSSETPATDNSVAAAFGLPEGSGTADDLVVLLARLQALTQGNSLITSKSGVEATKELLQSTAQERLEQLDEQLKKAAEAAKSGLIGKIFGYIGAALSMIVGAALIATGVGVAAGVALLAVGVATIVLMAVDETVGLDTVIEKMAESMAKTFNMSEADARIAATVILGALAIAASVAIGVINPAGGFAMAAVLLGPLLSAENLTSMGADSEAAGWAAMGVQLALAITAVVAGGVQAASKAGSSAAQVSKVVERIAHFAKLGGGLGSAAAQAGAGAAGIAGGVYNYQATQAEAQTQDIAADLFALNQQMETQTEQIREIQAAMEESMQIVGDMLSSIFSTGQQVATIA